MNAPGYYRIMNEGRTASFHIDSNSSYYEPFLLKGQRILGLLAGGESETIGFTRLTIPHEILGGEMTAISSDLIDNETNMNSTHSIVDLHYTYGIVAQGSSSTILGIMGTTVIPEFGLISILVLAAGVGVLTLVYRRR